MRFLVDLRFVVPPVINVTLWLLIPQPKPSPQPPQNLNNEIFVMACLFLVIAIILFLFTSAKLPLSVEPLQLRAGDFSSPLTLSLLVSIFFPSSLFWFVFPTLALFSPWYEMLSDMLKRFMLWFCEILQGAIPALFIICSTHQRRPPAEVLEEIVIEGNNEANI